VGFFGSRSTSEQEKDNNRERQRTSQYNTKISKKAKDKVKTDRDNDSRDKLANYKVPVKKIPAFIPGSTILNMIPQELSQKSFEVNRDYFVENVAGKRGFKNTFEDYKRYITSRGQGDIDASGRTINAGGGRDNNQNQGIELAKNATGTATTTGPGEIQKTATNTITTKDAKKKSSDAILVANKRKSRKSTIKTSATGLEEDYTLAKKKLLG
jgi:hypothetical protein